MNATSQQVRREITTLLTRIQDACRVYPTDSPPARKLTFATIRTAAETVAAVSEDAFATATADEVQRQVNEITATLDDLADRFGSDDPGRCGACAKTLTTAKLSGGRMMAYCTHCPTPMLSAVREISDLAGVDVL